MRSGLILADSNWHSTRNLVATWPPASNPDCHLLSLEPIDWQNAKNRGIPFWQYGLRCSQINSKHDKLSAILPPGWMKKWPGWGQRPLARAGRRWLEENQIRSENNSIWATYPFYLELVDQLQPSRLVYYNLDDYELYWPGQRNRVREWEAKIITKADFTVCVATSQAEKFRALYPARADRIFHLPHASPEWTIPSEPQLLPRSLPDLFADIPRPIIGYLGGLEDRLDWPLIQRIAIEFPDCSIVLVGPKPSAGDELWRHQAQETLALSNVYAVGSVDQRKIAEIYASLDVNIIPYDVRNAFNIACSPTKLLDAMGSGRPVVATALPECRLYQSLYHIAESHDTFVQIIGGLKNRGFTDGLEIRRWRYAGLRRSALIMDSLFRMTHCGGPGAAKAILAPYQPGVEAVESREPE
ncbi:MAG: glycosyltransferase [bacterium]